VVQLEYCLAAIELAAHEDAGLLELREDAIHSGQPDIDIFGNQGAIDVLRALVAVVGTPENVEDLQPGEGCLQSGALGVNGVGHYCGLWRDTAARAGRRPRHARRTAGRTLMRFWIPFMITVLTV